MPTIERILHATDFSPQSAAAAEYAALLAGLCKADLHLLYVLEGALSKHPGLDLGFPAPGERAQVQEDVWTQLQEAVGTALPDFERTFLGTRLGTVSDQIVSYADDNEIDVIVIGTHGRRGLAHAILGSVAEAVVRKASCPVLTVRPPEVD